MEFWLAFAVGSMLALLSILHLSINAKRSRAFRKPFGSDSYSASHNKSSQKQPSTIQNKLPNTSADDYANVFPPSRRSALSGVSNGLPSTHPLLQQPHAPLVDEPSRTPDRQVPLQTPSGQLKGHELTPTGFTVDQVRLLGDFPDYATLSGIPLPRAYERFDIDRALPRPYRPFRWAYHQTMSLMKLEPDWWIELDREYRAKIAQRKALYDEHGPTILQHLPGSEMACKELMEVVLQFLCARYPKHFALHIDEAEDKNGKRTAVFENHILGLKTMLDGSLHPLKVLLEHVPEDFAVMLRNPATGTYHFRAGVICSSLGWSLGSKIGSKLHEVHAPVPDYDAKMRFSVDRFFAKQPTDRGIQRGSWGFEVDRPLFMPPGDEYTAFRQAKDPALSVERVHLRVDWQTLRRLPLTGAVVFNFKALFTPLEELRDEPGVPALVLKVLREGDSKILEYKNASLTEHVVIPALEAWAREQEEQGVCEKGWQVRTLDDSPCFFGWEEKWKRQQGL